MERVAKVEPTRIRFVESLRLICDEWMWLSVTSPGALPERLASLRANIKRYFRHAVGDASIHAPSRSR